MKTLGIQAHWIANHVEQVYIGTVFVRQNRKCKPGPGCGFRKVLASSCGKIRVPAIPRKLYAACNFPVIDSGTNECKVRLLGIACNFFYFPAVTRLGFLGLGLESLERRAAK